VNKGEEGGGGGEEERRRRRRRRRRGGEEEEERRRGGGGACKVGKYMLNHTGNAPTTTLRAREKRQAKGGNVH